MSEPLDLDVLEADTYALGFMMGPLDTRALVKRLRRAEAALAKRDSHQHTFTGITGAKEMTCRCGASLDLRSGAVFMPWERKKDV